MVLLPVKNGAVDLVPTKIVAVGRNYISHAREMKSEILKEPVIFLKPPSSITGPDSTIILPGDSRRVEHEVELAVVIGKRAKNVPEEKAMEHIFGFTVLIDVTARDIQNDAKKRGLPWSRAKGYDTFAPIGPRIIPPNELSVDDLEIWLKVNGEMRQRGNTRDMIFKVPYIVSYISRIMTLEPGDIIATGTPAGVGPIEEGDEIEAYIEGIGILREKVKRE